MGLQRRSSRAPALSLGPLSDPDAVVLVLRGSVHPDDVPGLCGRAHTLLEAADAELIVCDVSGLERPDIAAVDVLARLHMTVKRRGGRVHLRDAAPELRDLLAFLGLLDVFPLLDLIVEARRKAEQGEDPGGVEEEDDPADPAV